MAGNRTLKLSLLADSSKFDSGLRKGESRLQRFGGGLVKAGKVAAGAGAAVAAVGAAAFGAASKVAAAADKVDKGSRRIGVSTDAYQELSYWASQNGIDHGSMERAVGRLNQRIGKAADGTGKYADAFAGLDVALHDTDGSLRSTEDVLGDTIEALRGIEDPAARSAAAAEVFGTKMARDLQPALADTSLSIEDAARQAHELGAVLDGDAVAAGAAFTDSVDRIKRAVGGMFTQALAPLMQWFANVALPLIEQKVIPALRRFGDWLGPKLTAAGRLLGNYYRSVVFPMLRTLLAWFRDRVLPAAQALAGFVTDRFVPAFRQVVTVLSDRLAPTFRAVWSIVTSIRDGLRATVTPIIAAFGDAFREVAAAVGGGGGGGGATLVGVLNGLSRVLATVAGFVARNVAPVIGRVLGGAIRVTGSALAGFVGTIRTALTFLSRLASRVRAVARAIQNSPIGKLASGAASGLGRLLGRASGGLVAGQTPYLVGERGPELFVPSGSGSIVPTSRTPTGGVTINVTGTMLDPEGVARAVERAVRDSRRRVGVLA